MSAVFTAYSEMSHALLVDEAMRLRAENAKLSVQLEQSRSLGKLGGYPCTPEHTWSEWAEDRHKRVGELEAENAKLEKTLAEANDEADVREDEGDTLVGQIKMYVQHRHDLASQNITLRKCTTELEAGSTKLREAISKIKIQGPDADGTVWVAFRPSEATESGMVSLGTTDRVIVKAALATRAEIEEVLR